jgi:hypothetical protein
MMLFELCRSGFEAERELFNDGVSKHVTRDALDFVLCLCRIGGERGGEGEHEVFSLAHVGDAIKADTAQGAGDGLPLRVEYRTLQCDVNMRCHQK